jgi:hypothetical protein
MAKRSKTAAIHHQIFAYERHDLYELVQELRDLYDFAQRSEATLSNARANAWRHLQG